VTTINQLPLQSPLSGGDQIVVWSPSNGDSRRSPLSGLVTYLNGALLPAQTGKNGRALTTDGTSLAWDWPDMSVTAAQLLAQSGTAGEWRYLQAGGASGPFVWQVGDYSAQVASDPLGGIYRLGNVPATQGAWVRDWDGIHGKPEWFGAVTGGPNCLPALQACVALCPHTQLALDDYWITGKWTINTDWRTVEGQGVVSYARYEGTRLLLASGTSTILQVGPDNDPGGNPQTDYLRQVRVKNINVIRAATIVPNATEANSPDAVRMRYTFRCYLKGVTAWESSIGFNLYGNVSSKLTDCWYFRSAAATTTVNDCAFGFYCVGVAAAFTGNNASVYFNQCKANLAMGSVPANSAGFKVSGAFADLYFLQPETTSFVNGFHAIGNGSGGALSSNINLTLISPVFDQPTTHGIRIKDTNTGAAISIVNPYVGVAGTAFAAMYVEDGFGFVSVTGGQFACEAGAANTLGLYVKSHTGFTATDLIIRNAPRPVFMESATDFRLQLSINNPTVSVAGASGAVVLTTSARGFVDCALKGDSGTPYPVGVFLTGTGNARVEVNCTRIDPARVTGGATNKLQNNSIAITSTGTFNTNCLVNGVMA